MQWHEMKRWRRILATGSMLLLAGACGGDKSPTGPGGGGGGNDRGIVGLYDLTSIGKVALGTELQIEDCIPVRFLDGQMEFYDDGTWDLAVDIQTGNSNQEYDDWGDYEQAGGTVWLNSEFGYAFQGTFDGTVAKLDYDFCPNGQTDIQLVLEK
jgi:hypothetical protein